MRRSSRNLAALLGDDLRGPLASAISGTMLARDMVESDDQRAVVLGGVLQDLDCITGLIDSWLQVSRDQSSLEERVDVEALLNLVAARQNAEVVCVPPSFEVIGNRCLLERAIENVCENSRRLGATEIHVAAQHNGRSVEIHIEDNCPGIDPGDAAEIFSYEHSAVGGTGLGLHVVAKIVADCAGTVCCVPLAGGNRFTISLPRADVALV